MTTEIATIEATPAVRMRQAGDVALACKQIVTATAMNIQGRKYVRVEGWMAIAIAHGCVASARDVEAIEGGIRALGEIRRLEDGILLCTAEGFVGDDEPMWAKRTLHARRAMAQTRAISRACRSAFAHVVVMMQAGLETTPAEEMTHEDEEPRARKNGAPKSADPDGPGVMQDGAPDKTALYLELSVLANDLKLTPAQLAIKARKDFGILDLDKADIAVLSDLVGALKAQKAKA